MSNSSFLTMRRNACTSTGLSWKSSSNSSTVTSPLFRAALFPWVRVTIVRRGFISQVPCRVGATFDSAACGRAADPFTSSGSVPDVAENEGLDGDRHGHGRLPQAADVDRIEVPELQAVDH